MNTQSKEHEDECHLCGGTGEVSISKDGTDKGTDYYGCPVCICRERDEEEARLRAANVDCLEHFNAIKAERDELLQVLKAFPGVEHALPFKNLCDCGQCEFIRLRRAVIAKAGA
jgi:hypothetical protein